MWGRGSSLWRQRLSKANLDWGGMVRQHVLWLWYKQVHQKEYYIYSLKNRPKPKRNVSSPNHHFSGTVFVLGSVRYLVLVNLTAIHVLIHQGETSKNYSDEFWSSWCFQIYFIVIPNLGKISILTNIFQRGWNHQLVISGILQSFSLQIHHTISTHQNERAHILGKLPLGSVSLPSCLSSHQKPFGMSQELPPRKLTCPPKKGTFQKGSFIWTDHHFLDMIWMICQFSGGVYVTSKVFNLKKKGRPTIDFPGDIP